MILSGECILIQRNFYAGMILSGEMHPQLPGPQVSETKHNTAASFSKQNTIPQFHFRNKTPLYSEAGVLTIIINKASKNTEKIRENIREDRENGE